MKARYTGTAGIDVSSRFGWSRRRRGLGAAQGDYALVVDPSAGHYTAKLGVQATPGRNTPYETSCGGGTSGWRTTLSKSGAELRIASGAVAGMSAKEIVTGETE